MLRTQSPLPTSCWTFHLQSILQLQLSSPYLVSQTPFPQGAHVGCPTHLSLGSEHQQVPLGNSEPKMDFNPPQQR